MKPLEQSEFPSSQREAEAIVDEVRNWFRGHHPAVQGMALAELTAIWLSGHPLEVREDLMALQCAGIRELVELADQERAAGQEGAS